MVWSFFLEAKRTLLNRGNINELIHMGDNEFGQLGNGSTEASWEPTQVLGLGGVAVEILFDQPGFEAVESGGHSRVRGEQIPRATGGGTVLHPAATLGAGTGGAGHFPVEAEPVKVTISCEST